MAYRVRTAAREDASDFIRLVRELAEFEKLSPPDPEAEARLEEDAFGPTPRIKVLLGEDETGGTVAYAILLETYSSFLAKPTLYLEDLYVTPDHRGKGLAETLMRHVAGLAKARGCGRIEGVVLDWNERARRFYRRTGAAELTEWVLFRYDVDAPSSSSSGLFSLEDS